VAVALIRDVQRVLHHADLSTIEHRLLRDMYLSMGYSLSFMLWSSVLGVAPLVEPVPHQLTHGYINAPLRICFFVPLRLLQALGTQRVRTAHGGSQTGIELLRGWSQLTQAKLEHGIHGFTLPPPLVHLASHNLWKVIALVESQHLRGRPALEYFGLLLVAENMSKSMAHAQCSRFSHQTASALQLPCSVGTILMSSRGLG
jgi:hypothetical protein